MPGWIVAEYQQDVNGERHHVWREANGTWSARIIRLSDSWMLREQHGFRDAELARNWCDSVEKEP